MNHPMSEIGTSRTFRCATEIGGYGGHSVPFIASSATSTGHRSASAGIVWVGLRSLNGTASWIPFVLDTFCIGSHRGKTDEQIAKEFRCRADLIAAQRQTIMEKLEIGSQARLAAAARQFADWPRWKPKADADDIG